MENGGKNECACEVWCCSQQTSYYTYLGSQLLSHQQEEYNFCAEQLQCYKFYCQLEQCQLFNSKLYSQLSITCLCASYLDLSPPDVDLANNFLACQTTVCKNSQVHPVAGASLAHLPNKHVLVQQRDYLISRVTIYLYLSTLCSAFKDYHGLKCSMSQMQSLAPLHTIIISIQYLYKKHQFYITVTANVTMVYSIIFMSPVKNAQLYTTVQYDYSNSLA